MTAWALSRGEWLPTVVSSVRFDAAVAPDWQRIEGMRHRARPRARAASPCGNGARDERVRLYLASRSPTGSTVAQAFRPVAGRLPPDSVRMEVIDVLDEPARARSDRVIATPTLIEIEPQPELRMIGSIGDEEAILRYLGLHHLAA